MDCTQLYEVQRVGARREGLKLISDNDELTLLADNTLSILDSFGKLILLCFGMDILV